MRRAFTLFVSFVISAFSVFAVNFVEETPLWPDDPSCTAKLKWFEPPAASNKTDVCVITIPGGGYNALVDMGLCIQFAHFFTKRGVTCAYLEYRCRKFRQPYYGISLKDARRAVRIIRSHAAERGYHPDKIGTISHSAGSHLALLLATGSMVTNWPGYFERTGKVEDYEDVGDELDKKFSPRTNFALTGAIAYALSDGDGKQNKNGGHDAALNPYITFDPADPPAPMCMMHGCADPWSPLASTQVFRKLKELRVPAELHLYADRSHNFYGSYESLVPGWPYTTYTVYIERYLEFMNKIGLFGSVGPVKSLADRFPDDSVRATHVKDNLWPVGKVSGARAAENTPYVEWHIPAKLSTTAVQIVCSGDGSEKTSAECLCANAIRRYINAKGMTVVTLTHRPLVSGAQLRKDSPAFQDLQRAVRLVRGKSADYGLNSDAIGTMGFKNGGYLAFAQAAKHGGAPNKHSDETDSFSGDVQWTIPVAMACSSAPEWLSACTNMPPVMFIQGSADANAVTTVKIWEGLRRNGVQSELHTLAGTETAFLTEGSPKTGDYTWIERIFEFLYHESKHNGKPDLPRINPLLKSATLDNP